MKNVCKIILTLLAISYPPSTVFAVTTRADYQNQVASASADIIELMQALTDASPRNADRSRVDGLYRRLFTTLPPTQKVDFDGIAIDVDNRWFADSLSASRKAMSDDERTVILHGIFERLKQLQNELDATSSDNRPAKDEGKRRIAEILQRPEFQRPEDRGPNAGERLLRSLGEWFNRLFPRAVPEYAPENTGKIPELIRLAAITLLVFAGIYLVFRIFRHVFQDDSPNAVKDQKVRVILGETIAEGSDADTLFREAENLAKAGDIRGAIRKSYIGLLLGFGDRKMISIARYKTNNDYLRELQRTPEVFRPAGQVTSVFEQIWYGGRDAALDDWEDFKSHCRRILGV